MKKRRKKLLAAILTLLSGVMFMFLISCSKKTVQYVFEVNGGIELPAYEAQKGSEFTLPVPERSGYRFKGWYATADYSGAPVEKVTAEQGATYYAKWAKLYSVNLNADGGTLSATSISLEAGENVYEALENYRPVKDGVVFGAWYKGSKPLEQNFKMPEEEISLQAKYKVNYTVEIWEESLDEDEKYEKAETLSGDDFLGYVGDVCAPEVGREGFKAVSHADSVVSKTLSSTASENVFKLYFKRESFTVTFRPNYPVTGMEDSSVSLTVKYGETVSLPSDYAAEGYWLAGWAESPIAETSDPSFVRVDSVSERLYNSDAEKGEPAVYAPRRNTNLYAVWTKGYTDAFGGDDYLFLFDEAVPEIYLLRGDIFFKGTYISGKQEFEFYKGEEGAELLFYGKLNEDGTFVYADKSRADLAYVLYKAGSGLVNNLHIQFGEYDEVGCIDSVNGESKGVYALDENGYYVVRFTEGKLAGQTWTCLVGLFVLDGTTTPAFQIRNEECAWGGIPRMSLSEDGRLMYYTQGHDIRFNGFSTAIYNTGKGYAAYNYVFGENKIFQLRNSKGELFSLQDEEGNSVSTFRIVEFDGGKGYMLYNAAFDQTFELGNGATLTMDGVYNAVYKNGDTTVEGFYTAKNSELDAQSRVVTFRGQDDSEHIFVVTAKRNMTDGSVVYTATEKLAGYCEYRYLKADGKLDASVLAINDKQDGYATLYGKAKNGEFIAVSSGRLVFDEELKLYVYTVEGDVNEIELSDGSFDITKVKSFVCDLEDKLFTYKLFYWYESTDLEDVKTEIASVEYISDTASVKLIAGAVAIYTEGKQTVKCAYKLSSNVLSLTNAAGTVYFEINDADKTFVKLLYAPYSMYAYVNGSENRNEYLRFDGKSTTDAVYVVLTKNADGETVETTYAGKYTEKAGLTSFGAAISEFKSAEKTFKFLALATSSARYFAPYNDMYNGVYEAATGAMLELDGYGFNALFIDANDEKAEGRYEIVAENVVRLTLENDSYRYFDLLEGRAFTVRGKEYGSYVLVNNREANGIFAELDGYGHLKIYTVEGKNKIYIDDNGVYDFDGGECILSYTDKNSEIVLHGELGTLEAGDYLLDAFTISHREVVQTYVNEKDWSVLILDHLGNAVKYTAAGERETGTYMLISRTMLYYVNSAGNDACIYIYDAEKGTATPIRFASRGYYTEDLETLLFTQYGYAIFNGERKYYNVEKDAETGKEFVYIYHRDDNSPNKNEYGFVKEKFGESGLFEKVKDFDGKVYYESDGFSIYFDRTEENAEKYPVLVSADNRKPLEQLRFAPNGNEEFSVQGYVTINKREYGCTVNRVLKDDGEPEMYITIATGSASVFRFDIAVRYRGADIDDEESGEKNTYEVTGMKLIRSARAYNYLDLYYLMYAFGGANAVSNFPNAFGVVSVVYVYNEKGEIPEGEANESYISGQFGSYSGMVDSQGKLLSFHTTDFEEEATGGSVLYKADIQGEDGYTYHFYFFFQKHQAFANMEGYRVLALTREETLPANDGYSVTVERIIVSDLAQQSSSFASGAIYSIALEKDGEPVEAATELLTLGNEAYYIVRTKDENQKITATVYYQIRFTENAYDSEEKPENFVATYQSVSVEKVTITTIYSADGKSYVDIDAENHKIIFMFIGKNIYYVTECSYDEALSLYTVTTNIGSKFTVKVEGQTMEIAEIEENL